ncbi:MAG: tetratricopeptide repeat protein [Isosphaeraceae bacterium]
MATKGGPAGAAALMVLGNDALVRNDHKEALRQFAAGYSLSPDLPILANNYAWSLANLGTPDPQRALKVIDEALKTHGNDPRLHGTRGGILAKLGRDKDAESELSAAVAAGYKHPEVLSTLANLRDRKKPSGASTSSPAATPPG